MPEKSQQRLYVEHYLAAYRQFANTLSEGARHDRARKAVHHGKYNLSVEEERECEAWLDEKFPARKREPDMGLPSLFDVPHVD